MRNKNIFKSLKAFAGDNDKIFVILDDRDDVWLNDQGHLPFNLLKIPGYFYHDIQGITTNFQGIQRLLFNIAKSCDLDLTLITFKNYLLDLHEQFFRNFEKKNDKLKDICYYIQRVQIFKNDFKLSFKAFGYKTPYEIDLCKRLG